jgi:hypothetical protein
MLTTRVVGSLVIGYELSLSGMRVIRRKGLNTLTQYHIKKVAIPPAMIIDNIKAANTFKILSCILSSPVFTRRYNPKSKIRISEILPPIEYSQIKVL